MGSRASKMRINTLYFLRYHSQRIDIFSFWEKNSESLLLSFWFVFMFGFSLGFNSFQLFSHIISKIATSICRDFCPVDSHNHNNIGIDCGGTLSSNSTAHNSKHQKQWIETAPTVWEYVHLFDTFPFYIEYTIGWSFWFQNRETGSEWGI